MTARYGEPFDAARAETEVTELLVADVPAAGPVTAAGDPATGEWTHTTGPGFRVIPLWEGGDLTGLYEADWTAATETAEAHLKHLAAALSATWGPPRVISIDGPMLKHQMGQPVEPLYRALFAQDLYGDLHLWGPIETRWPALVLGHSDGDAPLVLAALISTQEITQPPPP
ncbi:hypothetical protein HPO96_21710 [Kribbella sandramycini]|uniref:Uncharacterized protein n=1 Tax=Kribbella sandramycini TaxID=60450 RepID=A0A7Y4L3P0_9ACTN|nr:hypothetical protein [Kribbella sandramycini]MBB6566476.1 hypothetical protein [Kribbella sandramycini]NOL42867.1 hypothetical protein [Kribbella sandramycini]